MKRSGRMNSVLNNVTSSDNQTTTSSRSSSISIDNRSIEPSSLTEDAQLSVSIPIVTDSPIPKTTLSSSSSELDPMFNNRAPSSSPIVEQQIIPIQIEEPSIAKSVETASPVIETILEQPIANEISPPQPIEVPSPVTDQRNSVLSDDSLHASERIDSSLSVSISNGVNDLSMEKKIDDLLRTTTDGSPEIP